MRIGKLGFGTLAAVLLLSACSSQEPKVTTCVSDEYGIRDEQKITAEGDQVTKLEERIEVDFAGYGITEEDMSALSEEDLQDFFVSEMPELGDEIDGVEVSYDMDGTKVALVLSIDFANADTEALANLGIIDTDTDNISLDLSVEGLEQDGYTCTAE